LKSSIIRYMKNFGYTIDRLIKLDPNLKPTLSELKQKWQKRPSKVDSYWKKLLDYLNSPVIKEHPERNKIKDIISKPRARKDYSSCFTGIAPNETSIGIIPENLSCRISKHNRKTILLARDSAEFRLTGNPSLMYKISRRGSLLHIESAKIWVELKDHFRLWENNNSYGIRIKQGVLVLVEIEQRKAPSGIIPFNPSGIIPFNPDLLKKLFGPSDGDDDS